MCSFNKTRSVKMWRIRTGGNATHVEQCYYSLLWIWSYQPTSPYFHAAWAYTAEWEEESCSVLDYGKLETARNRIEIGCIQTARNLPALEQYEN